MEVKTETERTYWVGMTQAQAQNLLNVACMDGDVGTKSKLFSNIRQALLKSGLTQNEDPLQ